MKKYMPLMAVREKTGILQFSLMLRYSYRYIKQNTGQEYTEKGIAESSPFLMKKCRPKTT